MTEPRIPPLPPEEWEGNVEKILGANPPGIEGRLGDNNIFPTFARHKDLFRAWMPFGGFLLSHDASYVTGASLVADGGLGVGVRM